MKTYKLKDIDDSFKEVIFRAEKLWSSICKENFDKDGDSGSCVLGAGIYINFLPKGCRKPRAMTIINSSDVSCCQGSLNWERGKDKVLKYLLDYGIEAGYDWGRMD